MQTELTFEKFLEDNNIYHHDDGKNENCIIKNKKDFDNIIKGKHDFGVNGSFVVETIKTVDGNQSSSEMLIKEKEQNIFDSYQKIINELIDEMRSYGNLKLLSFRQAFIFNLGKIVREIKTDNEDDLIEIIKENSKPGYYFFEKDTLKYDLFISLEDLSSGNIGVITTKKFKSILKFKY
jgi:hypothetical protein